MPHSATGLRGGRCISTAACVSAAAVPTLLSVPDARSMMSRAVVRLEMCRLFCSRVGVTYAARNIDRAGMGRMVLLLLHRQKGVGSLDLLCGWEATGLDWLRLI